MMHLFSTLWNSIRRPRKDNGKDPRWVRAIPGAVPRFPLESRVQEVLSGHPICAWDRLVAEVAEYLRGSDDPKRLAVLDEGFWGGLTWSALAEQELRRLDGILLTIEA